MHFSYLSKFVHRHLSSSPYWIDNVLDNQRTYIVDVEWPGLSASECRLCFEPYTTNGYLSIRVRKQSRPLNYFRRKWKASLVWDRRMASPLPQRSFHLWLQYLYFTHRHHHRLIHYFHATSFFLPLSALFPLQGWILFACFEWKLRLSSIYE